MFVLFFSHCMCDVTYEVVGRTITISGTGTVEQSGVRAAGLYSSYELAVIEEGITTIGRNTFNQCMKLRQAILPSTLMRIEAGAFSSCGLYNLTIPKSLVYIGEMCFDCTLSMTDCVIESGCVNYQTIDGVVYENDANGQPVIAKTAPSGLTSVTIPDTVVTLYLSSFRWTRMTSIVIPNSVQTIAQTVFYSSKLKTIHIGAGLLTFDATALALCSDLEDITMDPGNTAFYRTTDGIFGAKTTDGTGNKASIIFIKEGVTTIHLDSTLTSFGTSLRSVKSLTEATIPSEGHPLWTLACDGQLILDKDGKTARSCVGGATSISFTLTGLITIAGDCCMESPCLETVVIGSGVLSIGTAAWRDCHKLSSFTFQEGNVMTSLPSQMCYVNKVLSAITIPATVTVIGHNAFTSCTYLKSVNLGNVQTIGSNVFSACSSLTSISLVSVTSIGDMSFQRCYALSNIDFGTGSRDVSLVASVFAYCSSLETVTLPSGLLDIQPSVFVGCSKLLAINIDSEVHKRYKSVNGALYSYDLKRFVICPGGIANIVLADSVEVIQKYSFYECSKLVEVIMYNQITTIESCAFSICNSIEMVRLPASVNTIGTAAFDSCTRLKYVFYCNNVDIPNFNGNPFSTNPHIYVPSTFQSSSFCGRSDYEAILDDSCHIPTGYFTSTMYQSSDLLQMLVISTDIFLFVIF